MRKEANQQPDSARTDPRNARLTGVGVVSAREGLSFCSVDDAVDGSICSDALWKQSQPECFGSAVAEGNEITLTVMKVPATMRKMFQITRERYMRERSTSARQERRSAIRSPAPMGSRKTYSGISSYRRTLWYSNRNVVVSASLRLASSSHF